MYNMLNMKLKMHIQETQNKQSSAVSKNSFSLTIVNYCYVSHTAKEILTSLYCFSIFKNEEPREFPCCCEENDLLTKEN